MPSLPVHRVRSRFPNFEALLDAASSHYGTSRAEILSPARYQNVAKARHCVAWVMRQHGMGLVAIGLRLNRDHTSIVHAVQRVDSDLTLKVDALQIATAAVRAIERAA